MNQEAVSVFKKALAMQNQKIAENFEAILPLLRVVNYEKGDKIIAAGVKCERFFFLASGFVKYVHDPYGLNQVVHIAGQGSFVSDFFSYYSNELSITDIYALSQSTLLMINKADLEKLYSENIIWANFGRKIAEHAVVQQIMRSIEIQTKSVEDRYLKYLEHHAELFHVMKLGDLAEILGVKRETLSRIRKRIKEPSTM